jgi:hypothetical protein
MAASDPKPEDYTDEHVIPWGMVKQAILDPATAVLPEGPLKRFMAKLDHEYGGYEQPPIMVIKHVEVPNDS